MSEYIERLHAQLLDTLDPLVLIELMREARRVNDEDKIEFCKTFFLLNCCDYVLFSPGHLSNTLGFEVGVPSLAFREIFEGSLHLFQIGEPSP